MDPPVDMITANGYDLQFGTNVIGHWLFTELLMPAILAASDSSTEKPRVITVSSSGAYLMKKFQYETLRDGPERRKLSSSQLYFQSKFVSTSSVLLNHIQG
jgi:retinol dehydrogenase-12